VKSWKTFIGAAIAHHGLSRDEHGKGPVTALLGILENRATIPRHTTEEAGLRFIINEL
jgi:hypothetical protein